MDAEPIIYTCPVVLAEIRSKVGREKGEKQASACLAFMLEQTAVVEHTVEIGIDAGKIHAEMKTGRDGFGMADAFVLASARSRNTKVLTGDPHFEGLEDALLL
jgi:predicted nucleic acid-binding protein